MFVIQIAAVTTVTYIEVNLAGHFTSVCYSALTNGSRPLLTHDSQEYAPWAVYKSVWYLLGRGELDSPAIDASLYPNQFLLGGSWAS